MGGRGNAPSACDACGPRAPATRTPRPDACGPRALAPGSAVAWQRQWPWERKVASRLSPRTLTCARPSGQPATYLHSTTREALGHPYLSGACRPRRGPAAFPPPGGGSRDLFVLPEQTDSRYDPILTLRKPGEGTRERVCRALTTVVST